MDESDATQDNPIYESALTELLAVGVDADVRPLINSWIESPELLSDIFQHGHT